MVHSCHSPSKTPTGSIQSRVLADSMNHSFLYPETAGRTLEDIDSYFRDRPSLLVFRDKVCLLP